MTFFWFIHVICFIASRYKHLQKLSRPDEPGNLFQTKEEVALLSFVCLPSLSKNEWMNEWNLSRRGEHGQSKYSGADPEWSHRALAIGEWTEVSECPFRVRALSAFHTPVCERFPLDELKKNVFKLGTYVHLFRWIDQWLRLLWPHKALTTTQTIIHGNYDENDTLLCMYVPQDNIQNWWNFISKSSNVKSASAANHPDWFAEPYTVAARQ